MANTVSAVGPGAVSAAVVAPQAAPAREVAAKKTVTAPAEVRAALAKAHQEVTGEPASNGLLDILTAHVSLETAGGTRMFNYNFGGIKGRSPAGETARYMTHEVLANGEKKAMSQPFRAYSTLQEGAADYIQVMRARFPEALEQARGGDPAAFASALKRRGYYTASEESYTSAIKRLTGDSTSTGRVHGAVSADRASASAAAVHGYFRNVAAASTVGSLAPSNDPLMTTATLARVMDAVSQATMRIGAPDEPEPKG